MARFLVVCAFKETGATKTAIKTRLAAKDLPMLCGFTSIFLADPIMDYTFLVLRKMNEPPATSRSMPKAFGSWIIRVVSMIVLTPLISISFFLEGMLTVG